MEVDASTVPKRIPKGWMDSIILSLPPINNKFDLAWKLIMSRRKLDDIEGNKLVRYIGIYDGRGQVRRCGHK